MAKYIDLHIHTTASDGTFSPTEIVKMAHKKKLGAIAITDHDTIFGLKEAEIAAEQYAIELVRGCELSTIYDNLSIHIVGLFIPKNLDTYPNFIKALNDFQTRRNNRNMLMLEKFNALGIEISLDELLKIAGGEIVARPHFAQLLKNKKIVSSEHEAFERFLKKDKPAYVARESITANQACQLFNSIGAIAVLAHPRLISIEKSVLEGLIVELKKDGLRAIEVFHSAHNAYDEKVVFELAKKHNLLISGGSDFHGKLKPTVNLGVGKGGLRIPYSYYEDLKNSLHNK